MQILGLLGVIIIGAAVALVYFSTGDRKGDGSQKKDGPRLPRREKGYTTSADGKVIYIFDPDEKKKDEKKEE